MNFLCDTNIMSEVMRLKPHHLVMQWLSEQEFIYLSTITVEEIYFGLAYKDARRQREWFERFISLRAIILPVTEEIAQKCGLWRGEFRQKGITRSQADLLIAATAAVHELVLATRNVKDFTGCGVEIFNPFDK